MRIILFAIMAFATLRATAQTTITGHLIDNEKNNLQKATIRCYIDDSVYAGGTTTDGKGEFKLKIAQENRALKLKAEYIGFKPTTMAISPTKEHAIRLGDIAMDKSTAKIAEVVVLGSNTVRTEDRTMIYPTKEQMRHAYDGYSAIDVMRILGLDADPLENTIRYHNQSVALCIDGREATNEEVQNLNPKDIKRIDLYTQGKPEYPDAYAVLDYVLKERAYAGTVAISALHKLTTPEGNVRATAQYFEGKSEYAISAHGSYNNFSGQPQDCRATTYRFPEATVTRRTESLSALNRQDAMGAYFTYLYSDTRQSLYASARFNRSHSNDESGSTLAYSNDAEAYTRRENATSQSISPALKLRYSRTLPKRQSLRVEAYYSYGNNHYDRHYENIAGSACDRYANGTREDSHYLSATANYTKAFGRKSSLNINAAMGFTDINDLTMRQATRGDLRLRKHTERLHVTYLYKIKRTFSIQASLAGKAATVKSGGNEQTNLFFTPGIRMSYLKGKHALSLSLTAMSTEASNANRTGDEYRINEYEVFVGNPKLKDYMSYNSTVDHTFDISPRLQWFNYAALKVCPDFTYMQINHDAGRGAFVRQNVNNGTYWNAHLETGAKYYIIPKLLDIMGIAMFNHSKSSAWTDICENRIYFSISSQLLYKGWRALVSYMTPSKGVNHTLGNYIKSPHRLRLTIAYSINDWNIEAEYTNPFRAATRTEFDNGEYATCSTSRTPLVTDNYGHIRVSYRFNFGKKKHKFSNPDTQDINQTSISKEN